MSLCYIGRAKNAKFRFRDLDNPFPVRFDCCEDEGTGSVKNASSLNDTKKQMQNKSFKMFLILPLSFYGSQPFILRFTFMLKFLRSAGNKRFRHRCWTFGFSTQIFLPIGLRNTLYTGLRVYVHGQGLVWPAVERGALLQTELSKASRPTL